MNKRILATLAVALLVGCSDDDEVTATPEVDTGMVEDTGGTTQDTTPEDTSIVTDGTVEETTGDTATAETTPGDATGDTRDGGDTAPTPTIKCGSTTCVAATQVCCGTGTGGGGAVCVPRADTGVCAAKFDCSNSDTCGAGLKCCAVIGVTSGSECKATCGSLEVQLCDSNDECPASDAGTDGGGACTPITGAGASTGYSRCQ